MNPIALARILLAPYGGGTAPNVAQWSWACGCDNAFAGTQCGALWTDKLWWGISIKKQKLNLPRGLPVGGGGRHRKCHAKDLES